MPPDDAINQMHRYRDAIYYRDYVEAPLKKEVIGGYILFLVMVNRRRWRFQSSIRLSRR